MQNYDNFYNDATLNFSYEKKSFFAGGATR